MQKLVINHYFRKQLLFKLALILIWKIKHSPDDAIIISVVLGLDCQYSSNLV